MIRGALLAAFLVVTSLPALASSRPAAVASIELFLRDDEKAILAAVLIDQAAFAELDTDVKSAGGDAKIMKLVLDKWRGRLVAFSETDVRIATVDLEGTYKNYEALMTPQTRAYMLRRLETMKESDRNTLIGYIDDVSSALSSNNGKLTWYTKKVVGGIFDKYRKELEIYLLTPIARGGKAEAPAAEAALAERRQADALEQARIAASAADRAGPVFDGGGAPPTPAVVTGGDGGERPRLDPPSRPADTPNLTATVPAPDAETDYMSRVRKMKTGPAPVQPRQYIPAAAGAAIGALLGFLLGGPIGAVIGALVGGSAGLLAGVKLLK